VHPLHLGDFAQRPGLVGEDFYAELGGFNYAFRDCGDYEMFCRALAQEPYARVGRPVACFRRTGQNNSANLAHKARALGEVAQVKGVHGPSSRARSRRNP
jgi:hypothetical protein